MKITINVEMDDIFQEDDQTFEESFKSHIVWQVKRDIWEKIKDQVEEQIKKEITSITLKEYEIQIRQEVQKVIQTGFVPGTSSKGKPEGEKISDWIEKQFSAHRSWNSPKELLDKRADQFAKEMRSRYDQQFASQVVLKMNEQGLLKDGVVNSLLSKKEQ